MTGAIRTFLASSLAMLAASFQPAQASDPFAGYDFAPAKTRYRNRFPGKRKPAGSKLARMAASGRVGRATIR